VYKDISDNATDEEWHPDNVCTDIHPMEWLKQSLDRSIKRETDEQDYVITFYTEITEEEYDKYFDLCGE
jgi:hypothetical protein